MYGIPTVFHYQMTRYLKKKDVLPHIQLLFTVVPQDFAEVRELRFTIPPNWDTSGFFYDSATGGTLLDETWLK